MYEIQGNDMRMTIPEFEIFSSQTISIQDLNSRATDWQHLMDDNTFSCFDWQSEGDKHYIATIDHEVKLAIIEFNRQTCQYHSVFYAYHNKMLDPQLRQFSTPSNSLEDLKTLGTALVIAYGVKLVDPKFKHLK